MKNSGIEWIGEIPDDWKVERLQWYIEEVKVSNNPMQTDRVLSLTNKAGVIPYEEKGAQGNVAKEDYTQYKLAYPNTIVANSMNILIGSVGICNYFGCVSPIYYVFKPTKKADLLFINYIMQTIPFQKELRRYANGILEIRLRVSANGILKRKIAIPSLEKQKNIVDGINKKCAAVDRLIENQQAQIEKLKEYKQSVITEAVTRGLAPSVPMKDSGIEWVGNIPTGWEVKRTKYVATSIFKGNGITKEDVVIDGDTPCLRYGEIYSKYDIAFRQCNTKTNKANLSVLQYFHYGDILFAGTGELVEEIGKNIVYLGEEECLAGGDIIVLRHKQNPAFLNYALYATCSQMQKSYGKAKLKVVHISAAEIGNIYIALPSIIEQQFIAEYLDKKCTKIDKLISIKQQKIEKLQEYKKSLIYEYVTGKKEVLT